MLVGQTPWETGDHNQDMIFRRIINDQVEYPSKEVDGIYVPNDAQDIINKLLVKDSSARMAGKKCPILDHPWFGSYLEANKLQEKKFKAPWVPKLKNLKDSSFFVS